MVEDLSDVCPHCSHLWDNHDGLLTGSKACDVCGCMWQPPQPPKPPVPPPTERDLLVQRIEDVLWSALQAQDHIYVDREMDMVDASGSGVDMAAVAAAVVDEMATD
jgi:hypothetical protein